MTPFGILVLKDFHKCVQQSNHFFNNKYGKMLLFVINETIIFFSILLYKRVKILAQTR